MMDEAMAGGEAERPEEAATGASASKPDVTGAPSTKEHSSLLSGRGGRAFVHAAMLVLLTVLAVVMFVPGIDRLPVTDQDEALFVQSSRQMMESGNWVDIRFQAEPRYKKPAGIYWLQVLATKATGHDADAPIWTYRLPSALGAVLVVLFTYAIGTLFGGPLTGLAAGLFAAATIELGIEARIAKTDAALAATVLAAQWALAHAYLEANRHPRFWRSALFWTALGLGVLIKGPITPLFAGLTLAVLALSERSTSLWRSLSPVRGLIWLAVLVLPWLIAIAWISHGAFFAESVGKDMLGKVVSGQQSHGAPPGTYILAAIGLFWPLSALVPLAAVHGWRHRSEPAVRFLAAWVLPSWILFELVPTKLPNYVLPDMPALALLTALAFVGGSLTVTGLWRKIVVAYIAVGSVVFGLGLNIAFVYVEGRADLLGLGIGVLATAMGLAAWRLWSTNRVRAGVSALFATVVLVNVLAYAVLLPDAKSLWLSDRLAEMAAELRPCVEPKIVVVGYKSPSVVFRLGTATEIADPETAAASFSSSACALAFVNEASTPPFLTALAGTASESAVPLPSRVVTARNIDGFKPRSMQVFLKSE
jgi:4-amino-4-deoxy-L-arabinose transferase-like glycosyltransferase